MVSGVHGGGASLNVEQAVRQRYSQGADQCESQLCCAVSYNSKFLEILPQEIIDRDYGCGDPTRWVNPGETVLDLGSGGGKACYITAQAVGPTGRVIGVDCNAEMLNLARRYRQTVAEKLGYDNVEFHCGRIQDLQLDLDLLGQKLAEAPIHNEQAWLRMRELEHQLRAEQPLIADDSVDVVISNCVLNLVRPEDRTALFDEIFRVLKPGGRMAISDIVSDQPVPKHMREDAELWSGCISGAFQETEFLLACERAGFYGIELVERAQQPWQVVEGIEFRSVTVRAYKASSQDDISNRGLNQAVIYRGPFRSVEDDKGGSYQRGARVAVSPQVFGLLQSPPYQGQFELLEQSPAIPVRQALPTSPTASSEPAGQQSGQQQTADQAGEDSAAGDCGCGPAGCC